MSEEKTYKVEFVLKPCHLFPVAWLVVVGLCKLGIMKQSTASDILVDHFMKIEVESVEEE